MSDLNVTVGTSIPHCILIIPICIQVFKVPSIKNKVLAWLNIKFLT